MKKKHLILTIAAACGTLFTGCQKNPGYEQLDDEFRVYTQFDPEADFGNYKTFYIPDSLLVIGASPEADFIKNSNSDKIINAYIANMSERGYRQAEDKASADLGIQVTYVTSTNYFVDYIDSPYWWWGYPGYWDPFYWGYGGYWGYSFPVYYSYDTNSLLTEIIDLTASDKSEDAEVPVLWNSFITGVSTGYAAFDIRRTVTGINQSFEQSPDFRAAQQ
jgi:hypothetical protein